MATMPDKVRNRTPEDTGAGGVLSGQETDHGLVDHLSPAHQAVFFPRGTYKEIAAALNLPIGTVRSRLSRARTALKQLRARLSPPGALSRAQGTDS